MKPEQIDWAGGPKQTKDRQPPNINNTKPGVSLEKAQLAFRLNEMLRRAPEWLSSASVADVRAWKAAHEKAKKVAVSSRSSVTDLRLAISSLEKSP